MIRVTTIDHSQMRLVSMFTMHHTYSTYFYKCDEYEKKNEYIKSSSVISIVNIDDSILKMWNSFNRNDKTFRSFFRMKRIYVKNILNRCIYWEIIDDLFIQQINFKWEIKSFSIQRKFARLFHLSHFITINWKFKLENN